MNGDVVDIKAFHGTDKGIVVEAFRVGSSFTSDASEGRFREIGAEMMTFGYEGLSGISFVIGIADIIRVVELF